MIGTCKFIFLLFFGTALFQVSTCSSWLNLGTTGYRGLVVAVHPSVSEQQLFTNHIQNLFNWTSHAFRDLTAKKISFEEVVIVLPFTWTKYFSDLHEIGDVFSKADIRVYGGGGPALPYTVQYSDCERQGRYIQMTSQFVNTADNSSGLLLAQEFARYRYGIFEGLNIRKDAQLSQIPLVLTTQGFRCDGRSSWDTLDSHPDFNEQIDSQSNDENTHYGHYSDTEFSPVFKFYRTRPKDTYMLIFDTSRTLWEKITPGWTVEMLGNLTFGRLVQQFLPNDSQVGFITYSDTANIMRGLTQISPFVRENFFEGISIGVKGTRQALANAIAKASEVLKEKYLGSKIIVVSDGNNDVAPPLENVTPILLDNMICASVMSPSMRYETNLKTLATSTDGEVYFLDSNWLNAEKTQTSMLDHMTANGKIQVYQGDILISNELTYPLNVYLDEFLGEETLFEFEGNHLTENGINIFLATSSAGVVYYLKNAIRRGTAVHFPVNDETGNWTILFANPARLSSRVRIRVTSRPRRVDLNPVLLESWVDVQRDVDYSTVRIFADLHKGPDAVLDARVTAFVATPQRDEIAVVLKDEGTGADLIPNDGVYSAYFTEFKGDGIYTVLTQADSSEQTRIHIRQRKANHRDFKREIHEDSFTRYKYSGSFTIHDYKGSMNKIPPCQVTDLTVSQDSVSTLTISWTAPGSDLDFGIVTLYDLRMGFTLQSESEEVMDVFKSWRSILTSDVVQGTLEPSPSGTEMNVTIITSDLQSMNGKKIYFALRSQDLNGNPSKISNIATFETQVHTLLPENTKPRPHVTEATLISESSSEKKLETTFLPKVIVSDEITSVTSKEPENEMFGSSESQFAQTKSVPEVVVTDGSTSVKSKDSVNEMLGSSNSGFQQTMSITEVVTDGSTSAKSNVNVNELLDSLESEAKVTTLAPDVTVIGQSTSVKSQDDDTKIFRSSESKFEDATLLTEITEVPVHTTQSMLFHEVTKQHERTSETTLLPKIIVTDRSTSTKNKYSSERNLGKTTTATETETEKNVVMEWLQELAKQLYKQNRSTTTTQADYSTKFEELSGVISSTDVTAKPVPVSAVTSKHAPHSDFMEVVVDEVSLNNNETNVINMNTSSDNYSIVFPYMEEDNETLWNVSYIEMMAPDVAMVKKEETFAEANIRTSSVVAAWAGGFCVTFVVIAGIAMMIRSWSKRGKYDVSKLEAIDSENCTTQELIGDGSTTLYADDSF